MLQSHPATFVLVVVTKLLESNGKIVVELWFHAIFKQMKVLNVGAKPVKLLEANRFNFSGL